MINPNVFLLRGNQAKYERGPERISRLATRRELKFRRKSRLARYSWNVFLEQGQRLNEMQTVERMGSLFRTPPQGKILPSILKLTFPLAVKPVSIYFRSANLGSTLFPLLSYSLGPNWQFLWFHPPSYSIPRWTHASANNLPPSPIWVASIRADPIK